MTPAASLQSHVLRLTNRSEDLDSLTVTLCRLCLSYLWPSVSLSLKPVVIHIPLVCDTHLMFSQHKQQQSARSHFLSACNLHGNTLIIPVGNLVWYHLSERHDVRISALQQLSWAELSWVRLWRTKRIRKWREAQNSCDDLMMGFRKINSVKSQMKKQSQNVFINLIEKQQKAKWF